MTIRILTLNNPDQDMVYIDAVISLVERTQLADAAPYLYSHKRGFFERNLSGETINFLALDGNKVIGYSALRKMDPWPEYLELGGHKPEECCLMLFNLVDPDYRGLGIGKQLSMARVASARKARFRHLFATVHPDNEYSVRALSGLGFTVIAQQPMFSNLQMRYLMHLNLPD
ncbi:MAG: GNAT family N-acetyltransferase [Arenicella sp.]